MDPIQHRFLNPHDPALRSADLEYVQRVVDGDTLVLGTGERVRLIDVNTRATKHPNQPVEFFGREAAAFTKRLAEGKWVKVDSVFTDGGVSTSGAGGAGAGPRTVGEITSKLGELSEALPSHALTCA